MFLIVPIQTLDESGISVDLEKEAAHFPVLSELVENGESVFLTPIRVEARVSRSRNLILVVGRVETVVGSTCSRCLKEFESRLSEPFSATYTPEPPPAVQSGENEIRNDEIGLFHFQGEAIDLGEAVQEQVVMMLAQQPLCSDSCKGLCVRCGSDRNAGDCGCPEPVLNERMAVLKNLNID